MDLKLKVHPPVVALSLAGLMYLASVLLPTLQLPARAAVWLAWGAMGVGLSCGIAAVVTFRRAKTTIDPTRPHSASALVTAGIYRFTRNPMYLGLLCCLLGVGFYLANWLALAIAWLFIPYMNRFQIQPEEAALTGAFGAEYVAYSARVRRWL